MGTNKRAGFTIIEVILFLGISGFLVVGFLVGVSASINVQRYKDAAETFKSTLQQQYADISSVQNGRNDNWKCDNKANVIELTDKDLGKETPGQSKCMLLGKYVSIANSTITTYSVVAYEISSVAGKDDITTMKNNYTYSVAKSQTDTSKMEWGTRIAWPTSDAAKSKTSRTLGMLILRSPTSGQVYTFTNNTALAADVDFNTSFKAMMLAGGGVAEKGQGEQVICINSGGMFTVDDRAVVLNSFASSASSIELQTNAYFKSKKLVTQC